MRRSYRRAFTLVEMLVVIGIIIALIAILLPAVNKAYKNAQRTSMQADLAVISQALDAYRNDFGDYPRIDSTLAQAQNAYPGSVILCWALIGPGPANPLRSGQGVITGGDGADGPGFRIRGTQGTIHRSYLNLDRFKIASISANGTTSIPTNGSFDDGNTVILDRFGKPILYFPANKSVQVTSLGTYVGPSNYPPNLPGTRFNTNDAPVDSLFSYSGGGSLSPTQAMLRLMPGVLTDVSTQSLDATAVTNLPYLLWSAGPDGQFGSDDDATNMR